MRHGVIILPEHHWPRARQQWLRAEELGFDHAWTYDHLMWRWLRTKPWFASVPTLTAAAAVTSRIELGTMVASPTFRHPVTFAKEMMTLDDIAGGRAICGIGAGARGYDDTALGSGPATPAERAARFEEFVELTHQLLTNTVTDWNGRYYTVHDTYLVPGCVRAPRMPFAIAATGPRGIALAARRADIWVTAGTPGWSEPLPYRRALAGLSEQANRLEDACAALGRDPSTVRRLVVTGAMITGVTDSAGSYADACGEFERAGFTDLVIHWPRPSFPYDGDPAVLDDIGDLLSREARC